ncbi:ornithine cyclodeaminase [Rhodoferax sp.]|uniref:ornithine cyclodeaminase n=1 Tax=Rhodoferax sp. TaxID=50421 RepID=UPI00271CA083|nr:ornithine cyclodeaminase [Rhodoferax sp.]MDO9146062.1 ornithine cyclodeaminase [Rhodoferax sp.]MDP3191617.1 ornithine cyclodeaminase [Rhodoferax sp.]MDP3864774.1 ornithine cyclodeaminase [Rhodoferax sp.]
MTRFIDVPAMTRLIEEVGLTRIIDQLSKCIEEDFLRWNDFDKSARVANHSEIGVIELMPVSNASHYAFKYVNGHPNNTVSGLSTVMAFGVLAEVQTGFPILLSELTVATALRTCATSLMAARALSRSDAKRMALIGNGAQAEFQAIAFHALFGINEIVVYDVDPQATEKLLRNLAEYPALKKVRATSIAQAVRGADIITTVTADKTRATIITPEMVEPGMHINAVGGDCPGKTELHVDVLRGARVFVEYEPQTRVEGDIQQLDVDFPVVDLWRVLSGDQPGRQTREQVTVFDSVGFALEDYSTLRYVNQQATKLGLGVDVELVPSMDDPKDLFRFTRSARAPLLRRVV